MRWIARRWPGSAAGSEFVANLSAVAVLNAGAFFLQFCALLLIGRAWGPALYGRVTLVGNITALLFIPFSLGMNNAMYRLLPVTAKERHGALVDTAAVGNLITSACLGLVLLLGHGLVARGLSIPFDVWAWAVVYSAATNFVCLFESFLRGKRRFAEIGKLRLLSAALFFAAVLIFVGARGERSLGYYYGPYILIYALVFVSGVIVLLRISFSRFQWRLYREMIRYGLAMMGSVLFTALIYNSDVIVLTRLLGDPEQVGVFAAYQGVVKLAFYVGFHEIFTVVFLPTIARLDGQAVFRHVERLALWIAGGVFLAASLVIVTSLWVFGGRYVFSPLYWVLSSASIALLAVFQLYNATLSMEGEAGARTSLFVALIVLPGALALQVVLTRSWGVPGMMAAILLTNLCLLLLMHASAGRFYRRRAATVAVAV